MALRCLRAGAVHSINNGHRKTSAQCPLYPQKRTSKLARKRAVLAAKLALHGLLTEADLDRAIEPGA
jgi:hypothetical protein